MTPTTHSSYDRIRTLVQPGDAFAFTGRSGLFSWAIRTFTGRPTHIAPVAWIEEGNEPRLVLVEAIEGKGVVKSYASERVESYDGEVYWMRFDGSIAIDRDGVGEYLRAAIGKPYNMARALLSALGQWFRIPGKARRDALFCSHLALMALRQGGKVNEVYFGKDHTPTPAQFARFPVWRKFVQIKGDPEAL